MWGCFHTWCGWIQSFPLWVCSSRHELARKWNSGQRLISEGLWSDVARLLMTCPLTVGPWWPHALGAQALPQTQHCLNGDCLKSWSCVSTPTQNDALFISWEAGGVGGLWVRGSRNGQKTWRGVGACWGVRRAGSLDKLTVLDWLWGRVADVGINFILLLFAPRLYRPLLWREEQNQLYCFDAAVSRECMTSLYSSLNFKLHSVAPTSLGFKSGGFFLLRLRPRVANAAQEKDVRQQLH